MGDVPLVKAYHAQAGPAEYQAVLASCILRRPVAPGRFQLSCLSERLFGIIATRTCVPLQPRSGCAGSIAPSRRRWTGCVSEPAEREMSGLIAAKLLELADGRQGLVAARERRQPTG